MKIIQSWDDGTVDDIRLIAVLRKYRAKATFNLSPGLYGESRSFGWKFGEKDVWRLARGELVSVYDGFEIASHSCNHPNLIYLPQQDLEREIRESKRSLEEIFGRVVRGFCYPFNGYDGRVKDAVRSGGYLYARGERHEQNPVFPPSDPFEFTPHCHFRDIDFREKYEAAKAHGEPVFFFWGHSYEIIDEPMWEEVERQIWRMAADPESEWSGIADLFAPLHASVSDC